MVWERDLRERRENVSNCAHTKLAAAVVPTSEHVPTTRHDRGMSPATGNILNLTKATREKACTQTEIHNARSSSHLKR
jgi:hypothetical protein